MYLGRERLGTKKQPIAPYHEMDYGDEGNKLIEEAVSYIKRDYPEFTDTEARIWEVLSRYRGEAGLSAMKVSNIASAIMQVINYVPPEPPFDENHHRFHTPNSGLPSCANCVWLNWAEEE